MSRPNIRPEHKAIVEQAMKNILAEADSFNMSDWITKTPKGEGYSCGTAACLAGHITLAAGFKREVVSTRTVKRKLGIEVPDTVTSGPNVHVSNLAGLILGNEEGEIDALFMTDGWPTEFRTRFEELSKNADHRGFVPEKDRRKKIAKLAVARLKHYLKTGE